MKGSRPIISFDGAFNEEHFMTLQKELLIHALNVPKHHPKCVPCCDRVFSFVAEDAKIWFRHYEVYRG